MSVYIYFFKRKTGNSRQYFICLRYDSHVTLPSHLPVKYGPSSIF